MRPGAGQGGAPASSGPATPSRGEEAAVEATEPKKKTSPAQFFSQVRAEGRKIVWPSRKETWITSVMVFIMVLIAALFFWVVDTGLGFAFRYIIALGS